MKNLFTRRNFLQTTAISGTAVMLPGYAKGFANPAESATKLSSGELPKRRLGRTNRMVSCIGFGAGSRYCNWKADANTLQKHIDYAIKLGITYFDAARSYGGGLTEERYGKYLTPKYRDQIFLNSKTEQRTYSGVMSEFATTMATLKTDHLDLYCMHAIDTMDQVDALLDSSTGGYKAFLKLKNDGDVQNIGFSFHKWSAATQKAFQEFNIDAVLCAINAAEYNGNENEFIPFAIQSQRDVGIIAIKTMGQNSLIGNVSGNDLLRYALSLPISVANVGMDGFAPLDACVGIGKEPVISAAEAEQIHLKLNFDPRVTALPYFTG